MTKHQIEETAFLVTGLIVLVGYIGACIALLTY